MPLFRQGYGQGEAPLYLSLALSLSALLHIFRPTTRAIRARIPSWFPTKLRRLSIGVYDMFQVGVGRSSTAMH